MKSATWLLAAAFVAANCGLAFAAETPADKPADKPKLDNKPKTDDAVVRVLERPAKGAAFLKIAPPIGPGADTIAIPAMNDPDPVLMDLLLNVRRGTLLEVKTNMVGGKRTLVDASAYDAKPGEDEPNVYVLAKRTTNRLGGSDIPALEVTKFLKTTTFVLPFTKDKDGKVTPNAEMLRTLEAIKDGDSLEAVGQTSSVKPGVFMLKSLKAYVPWEKGIFAKLSKKKFQGEDYTALEVLADGENVAMLMKAKDEALITGVVNKIKHGNPLLYRSKTTDDTTWVTEVKAVLPEVVKDEKPDNPKVVNPFDKKPPRNWGSGRGGRGRGR